MSSKKQSDKSAMLIGVLICAFILWKGVGYILPDQPKYKNGKTLLSDVLKAHGGKQEWNEKANLSFSKAFKLYQEDGRIEIDRKEEHNYSYSPSKDLQIAWEQDQQNYLLQKTENSIVQFVNDSIDALATTDKLNAKLNAATFVINLPYSLDDNNALLAYNGIQEFQNQESHVLQVNFRDSKDTWWLYFSTNALEWLGYWVHTSDHYSLVINEEMISVKGFMLSRKRKSFRTDSLQNITYLRATYDYSGYTIN